MPGRSYWDGVHAAWRQKRPQQLWRRHSDAVDMAWLRALLPAGRVQRLLKTDLFNEGISPGLYPMLAPLADSVVGIDLSLAATRSAQARHHSLRAVTADVQRLPFAAGTFDVIVSNSTLDHFERAGAITASLEELRRVLRSGGHLLISLDNLANPLIALRNSAPFAGARRRGMVPYYVGSSYGPRRLRRALGGAGFHVDAMTATLHCPRVIAVACCALCERFGGAAAQERLLRWLMAFERLGRWPTCYATGHFVVATARKR